MSDDGTVGVRVDWDVRIGPGMCAGAAPEGFAFAEQRRFRPLSESIDPDLAVRDATASCPVEAISLTDVGTDDPVDLDWLPVRL